MSNGTQLQWRTLSGTAVNNRTDDIWFQDEMTGWLVNSDGKIRKTIDGGASWTTQLQNGPYLRCIGFANDQIGWVGTLSGTIYRTTNGQDWSLVNNLPSIKPSAVCGIYAVDESVAYAAGTNYPFRDARMVKTTDGGDSWTGWEMDDHAALLVDTYFIDDMRGWVVGGKADGSNQNVPRSAVRAVVLFTEDGGQTWVNRAEGVAGLQLGEWGWKIQFLTDQIGFVSLENFSDAAILKTTDGGETWERLHINDPQENTDLEGVGFFDENLGWVGGWGQSSESTDGGSNWVDANQIGTHINRFRFIGNPPTIGYASGKAVYKYSAEPVDSGPTPTPRFLTPSEREVFQESVPIEFNVPDKAENVRIDVWDRFGEHIRELICESYPQAGRRTVEWCFDDQDGEQLPPGFFIYRLTIDGDGESRVIRRAE